MYTYTSNGNKIYTLFKANDKESANERRRVDLINDFEFPKSCENIAVSGDGQYILASGSYPPQIAIFDTLDLTLKHRRGIDHHVLKGSFLSNDYRKLVLLCDNRYIEFHNQSGRYYTFRVPKQSRDMAYLPNDANLYIVGSTNLIYRMDLGSGKFNVPLETSVEEINSISINKGFPIFSVAGSEGLLETWDHRSPTPASKLTICNDVDLTFCTYSENGLKIAVGDSDGTIRVYDIRSRNPLWERTDINKFPINKIQWLASHGEEQDKNIAWSSRKSIKISNAEDGDPIATIESSYVLSKATKNNPNTIAQISSFTFYPSSGLCFIASDQPKIGSLYIPSIGPSPKWCSFLENITEELTKPVTEESTKVDPIVVVGNSVFITEQQLDLWSVRDLLGTDMVKPYLHGYLIDKSLYRKLKEAFDEISYMEYKKKKATEKLEEKIKRSMRIPVNLKKAKVNEEYAKQLMDISESKIDEKAGSKSVKKAKEAAERARKLLEDDRFTRIFTDKLFSMDNNEG